MRRCAVQRLHRSTAFDCEQFEFLRINTDLGIATGSTHVGLSSTGEPTGYYNSTRSGTEIESHDATNVESQCLTNRRFSVKKDSFQIDAIAHSLLRHSSMDFVGTGPATAPSVSRGHSRTSSTDSALWALHQNASTTSHMRQKSAAFTEQFSIANETSRPASVILLAGHHNWISAAYSNNGQSDFSSPIVSSLVIDRFSGDVLQDERYQRLAADV